MRSAIARSPRWQPTRKAWSYPSEVQAIADRLAPRVRKRFLAAIARLGDAPEAREVEAAIRSGDAVALARLFRVPELVDQLDGALAAITQAFGAAGETAYDRIAGQTPLAGAFDVTNPRAIDWARTHGAELITGIQTSARAVIREIIGSGVEQGRTVAESARLIRRLIGLTERQAQAVIAYRAQLAEDGRDAEAIARLGERYARQLLNFRARVISITETQTAVHEGQREAWRQAAGKGLFDPETATQVWMSDPDACDICAPMDGQEVAFGEQFETGDGEAIDGPIVHPMCRCNVSLRFDRTRDEE